MGSDLIYSSIIPDIKSLQTDGESVVALLNAVVHRDYTNSSDIQIKIFDDRITLFSPGKLYGGLTISDLATDNYQSSIRNKLIAEAFYLTKNIEKYGSGFIRIRKELEMYPNIVFNLEEVSSGLLVTFLQKGSKGEGVNEGVNALFSYIMHKPGLRIPDFSRHFNAPSKTIERWIKQLRSDNEIVFKGPPKRVVILYVNNASNQGVGE